MREIYCLVSNILLVQSISELSYKDILNFLSLYYTAFLFLFGKLGSTLRRGMRVRSGRPIPINTIFGDNTHTGERRNTEGNLALERGSLDSWEAWWEEHFWCGAGGLYLRVKIVFTLRTDGLRPWVWVWARTVLVVVVVGAQRCGEKMIPDRDVRCLSVCVEG